MSKTHLIERTKECKSVMINGPMKGMDQIERERGLLECEIYLIQQRKEIKKNLPSTFTHLIF